MDNRSLAEIKQDINSNMITLGKLIVLRRVAVVLSIITLIICIIQFILLIITPDVELSQLINILVITVLSLIFSAWYTITVKITNHLKQRIYSDKQIIKKI